MTVEVLDRKDRQILLELDQNSRASYSVIAKRLKLPLETVRYRVQALQERGVIQNLFTVIDGGRLGFYYYKVFLKLHNVDEAKVCLITEFLSNHPEVNWVVRVDGNYDLGFTIRVPHPIALSKFIDDLRTRFSDYIHSWVVSVNITMDFFSRSYLTTRKRKQIKIGAYSAHSDRYGLDKTDSLILEKLAKDARASAAEISRELNVTDDTVLNRIKRLERDKIITRYGLVIDNAAIGQVAYYVLIYLNKLSKKRREEFLTYCTTKENVIYLIKALGEWDYEFQVEGKNIDEYRELMMEMTTRFSDIIRDYNGMMIRKIVKYTYP